MAKQITGKSATTMPKRVESVGEPMAHTRTVSTLLPHEPAPPFLLMAHPAKWHVVDGKVLPRLKALPLQGGINGVRVDEKTGMIDDTQARAHFMRKGFIVIELDEVPGFDSYVRKHNTVKGPLYLTAWERPIVTAGGPIIRRDDAGWVAFLEWISDNKLPVPEPEHLGSMRDMYLARVERRASEAALKPSAAKKSEADQKIADAFSTAIEAGHAA